MKKSTGRSWIAGLAALVLGGTAVSALQIARRSPSEAMSSPQVAGRQGLNPDEHLLFNGWGLTPAGNHLMLEGDMPLRMVPTPDGRRLAAVTAGFDGHGVSLIDLSNNRVSQFLPLPNTWNGLAFHPDGRTLFVSGGAEGSIHRLSYRDGRLALVKTQKLQGSPSPRRGRRAAGSAAAPPADEVVFASGLAVAPDGKSLWVCNEANHELIELNAATLEEEGRVSTGEHPHSIQFGADRRHLYVSNWGSRSVSVIDSASGRRVRDIIVGRRPNDMALSRDGRLFVACAGDNTVHVVQTRSLEREQPGADPSRRPPEGTREIIATSIYPDSPEGSTPSGVAVSPDGNSLYVANSDNNAVMVADISNPEISVVGGFIPTGWYPTAVAVSPDSRTLYAANGKGLRYYPNYPARLPNPRRLHAPPPFDYVGQMFEGSISAIPVPDQPAMVEYTKQVRANSPYTPRTLTRTAMRSSSVIPDRTGAPCPIKYVLYIIKENRTYDQVFGDLRDANGRHIGNGDPNLVMFGEDVAPNHHQLARDTVVLDNLYCNGEVSVDGHSWCDAAMATDYNQRRWILSYSRHGTLPGNDEMEVPTAGYLWDLCQRHGVSYKCYGEGARRAPSRNRGTWPAGRDMDRVDGFISDLQQAEETGELPRFMIMSLGEDHTQGTTPGRPTPQAAVASNDIGLGKIVEACSRSKFWKEMAIFVIEDDAQNGPDHVDAHRTIGLVISPYVRRGVVDSTLYTTAGMIRTMELILGLPPLTQYDAGATPMFNSFQRRAEPFRYRLKQPRIDVNALNPPNAPGAQASSRMNWSEYDLIPEDELNRILWRATRPGVPYPAPIHRAVFTRTAD